MIQMPWTRWLPVGAIVALLAGCATLPISQAYRDEAKGNLTLSRVQQDPEKYAGATVIWGARIIETANTPSGSELVLVEMPLDAYERPQDFAASEGRFIAKTNAFLDPEIYQVGTDITIAGRVTGHEERPLGKSQYTYPVLDLKQGFLWRDEAVPYYYGYGPYYYWPYPYGYWNWDWYWDWHEYGGGRPRGGRHFEGREHFEHHR